MSEDKRDQRSACKSCGQDLPTRKPQHLTVTDRAILEGLSSDDKAMLYAPACAGNTKLADASQWFLTGPQKRRGYLPGPFKPEQVQRLAAAGEIVLLASDAADTPCAYVHWKFVHRWPALVQEQARA